MSAAQILCWLLLRLLKSGVFQKGETVRQEGQTFVCGPDMKIEGGHKEQDKEHGVIAIIIIVADVNIILLLNNGK